jgi:hypothetical protein
VVETAVKLKLVVKVLHLHLQQTIRALQGLLILEVVVAVVLVDIIQELQVLLVVLV